MLTSDSFWLSWIACFSSACLSAAALLLDLHLEVVDLVADVGRVELDDDLVLLDVRTLLHEEEDRRASLHLVDDLHGPRRRERAAFGHA